MEDRLSIVKIENLEKIYSNGVSVKALSDITLDIYKGEFVALIGSSGSGKTTLLNMISSLDYPTSGNILVDAVDIGLLEGNELADFRREKIGFIFQLFHLIPTLTALENVMMPLVPFWKKNKSELEKHAQEIMNDLGLGDHTDNFPGQLSGGEQQRVAIARAIVNNPRIILADEPTGNLDSKSGEEVMKNLRRLNQETGISIILVTHDMSIIRDIDRSIVLKDGRLQDLNRGLASAKYF